jgi:Txe/YoeB family toxin of toxin-antitoxin system
MMDGSDRWDIVWTRAARKDRDLVTKSPYNEKARSLIAMLRADPYMTPPYECLVGDLSGALSRRINIQHRLVYQVLEAEHAVKILSMWNYYE